MDQDAPPEEIQPTEATSTAEKKEPINHPIPYEEFEKAGGLAKTFEILIQACPQVDGDPTRERLYWWDRLSHYGYRTEPPRNTRKDFQYPFQNITPPTLKRSQPCEFVMTGDTYPKLYLHTLSTDDPRVILQVHDNVKKGNLPLTNEEANKLSKLRQALEDAGLPVEAEVATFPK
jgi:hypothetical protein